MSVRRVVAGALAIVGLGLAGVACPAIDLSVRITEDGIQNVVVACETFRSACAKGLNGLCNKNPILCDPGKCKLRNPCEIPGNPDWAAEKVMGLSLLVIEAGPAGLFKLKRKSRCVPLNLKPCVLELGCSGAPLDAKSCITSRVGRAVDDALGDGLTFDGFDSRDDVLLVGAIHRAPAGDESCDDVAVPEDVCAPQNLVAAAGLAAPVGGSTFDITCASCQGSTHVSFGRDNGPCPPTESACFVARVAKLLEESGK